MNKKWKKKRTQFFYWKIMITKVYLYDQVLMESMMDLLIVIVLFRKEEKWWHIILLSDYIAQDHAVTTSKWMTNQMMPVFHTSNQKTDIGGEKHIQKTNFRNVLGFFDIYLDIEGENIFILFHFQKKEIKWVSRFAHKCIMMYNYSNVKINKYTIM